MSLISAPSQHSVFSPSSSFRSQQSGRFQNAGVSVLTSQSSRPGTVATVNTDDPTVSTFSKVTEHDLQLARLGYKDLNKVCGTDGIFYYREEFCGACGILHSNPEVLDTYTNCEKCQCVVREPSVLRKRVDHTRQRVPLEILFATYGDPFIPESAREVTDITILRVQQTPKQDRLTFSTRDQANSIFGFDPSPGKNKQLRVRYRMNNIHATLILDFNTESRIPAPFILTVPRTKYVRILHATYGHPKGRSSSGSMSFDIQEILQSLVDQNGGTYLQITAYTPLARMLGDPCPGYSKDLRIEYEVLGKAGEATYDIVRGRITKRVHISSAPTIAPIIFVTKATYGITPTAKKERVETINKELAKIVAIEHRQSQGLPMQGDEVKLLRSKDKLIEMREIIRNSATNFYDVSVKMQKIVDEKKYMISLSRHKFDPNAVFGNPCPGLPKMLDVYLDCTGHDSEKRAESNEMTDTGFARNFIAVKKGHFNIVVNDSLTGQGVMEQSLDFSTSYVCPMVVITRALYGELDDLTKVMDVTFDVQAKAHERALVIDKYTDVTALFKVDPSPGRNKKLKIFYISRGYTGNLRVREKDDCLAAGLELGYPPHASLGDDDANHVSRTM